jgi:hypothetical protein
LRLTNELTLNLKGEISMGTHPQGVPGGGGQPAPKKPKKQKKQKGAAKAKKGAAKGGKGKKKSKS